MSSSISAGVSSVDVDSSSTSSRMPALAIALSSAVVFASLVGLAMWFQLRRRRGRRGVMLQDHPSSETLARPSTIKKTFARAIGLRASATSGSSFANSPGLAAFTRDPSPLSSMLPVTPSKLLPLVPLQPTSLPPPLASARRSVVDLARVPSIPSPFLRTTHDRPLSTSASVPAPQHSPTWSDLPKASPTSHSLPPTPGTARPRHRYLSKLLPALPLPLHLPPPLQLLAPILSATNPSPRKISHLALPPRAHAPRALKPTECALPPSPPSSSVCSTDHVRRESEARSELLDLARPRGGEGRDSGCRDMLEDGVGSPFSF